MNRKIILIFLTLSFCQNIKGDLLTENPINPIPQEMTFDEYQDMNRRISMGLLLSAIPIPGTIHQYSGELETAKKLRWAAIGGITSILIGLSTSKDDEWHQSPYNIYVLNEGQNNEIRYEMIPTGSIGEVITYDYIRLNKTPNKASGLVILGMGILIADYIYDYAHGIQVIETKRDKVRYKYGKKLDFSFFPTFDLINQSAGMKLLFKL